MKKSVFVSIAVGLITVIVISLVMMNNQQSNMQNTSQKNLSDGNNMTSNLQISKIKIIASFYPLYEFSKNVSGDKAEISVFTPVGIEPHDWEPSTGNLIALKRSDIFVYNGAGLDPFVEKLIGSEEYSNVLFVKATDNIDLIKIENEKHADENNYEYNIRYDPHIWLDPIMAKQQVMVIKDAMIKTDPDNIQYYENNANTYSIKLDELDSKIRSELLNCKKDTIVPFHNAFTYFGNRYGISIHALSGLSPESEATANELKDLVDFIKKNEINVVFAEELVNPKLAQVLADEAGVQVMILSPLEGISKEDLAKGATYISKMEENLKNIKVALECQ